MKYKNKSYPFTSLHLRNIRILTTLLQSFTMSNQYSQSNKALSFLLPLLKADDKLEIFQWFLSCELAEFSTDKFFELLHKLFILEKAMIYQVLFKLKTSVAEALKIIDAVIFN